MELSSVVGFLRICWTEQIMVKVAGSVLGLLAPSNENCHALEEDDAEASASYPVSPCHSSLPAS